MDKQVCFKGPTKLYSRVFIILFGTGLYESAFSIYSFGTPRFSSLCVVGF